MPRPLVLIPCYFPRSVNLEGVGSLTRGLAKAWVQQGWRVKLLLPTDQYQPMDGVEIVTFRPGLLRLGDYHQAIARHSPQADAVLLIENNPNMSYSAQASKVFRNTFAFFCTPLQSMGLLREIGMTRQALLHAITKHRWLGWLRDWSSVRCIVGSQFQADQLIRLGVKEVHVLPVCGVSRDRAMPQRQAARANLQWDDRPVVGYLGHFSGAKGVEVLLEAFSRIAGQAVLAVAHSGKGRLSAAGRRCLQELITQGRIRMQGVVDVPEFLSACDLIALPYVTTSIFHQPQVLLESFACGTAVLTTSVGGFGEVVVPGQTGCLVPPRDATALTAAIDQALAQRPQMHQMGLAGRAAFERSYCAEAFVQKVIGLMK